MPKKNQYGLILAGGRGTRFWPRSRKRHAKQVLCITGERTLIQQTADRLRPAIPPERIWILTNDFVRDEIVRQLPEVPASQIIAEPAQRNTAPPIGLMAQILHAIDPDAVFGVFPSDHVIGMSARYLEFLGAAFEAAERGDIAVLGIKPRWPDTGYGYIEFPAGTSPGPQTIKVASFHEKPEPALAERFFAAGNYYWNAGMFFWRASAVLEAMRRYQPKTATLLSSLPASDHADFAAKLAEVFPLCTNISIDFGVLEHADNVVGIACDEFQWNDVGSWKAVYELLPRDADGNTARSEILAVDSRGNYVDCGRKLVALVGVENLVVVDTPDALLIAHRDRAQNVGRVVEILEEKQREDLL